MINPALTIFDERIKDVIHTDFETKVLADDCSFSEGPLWNRDGYYLFSDIPRNEICKISPGHQKQTLITNSGCTLKDRNDLSEQIGSNGLAYDANGGLYICQHGNGAIAKWDGDMQPLLTEFNGKRFNSPNDLVIHPNGSIFFSDPPYGLKEQKLALGKAQPVGGIYCVRNGTAILFCTRFQYPNGVCLSPDEKIVYCCSNKSFERFVLAYNAATLELKGTVCNENGDGIKCDRKGNLYLCTKEGILIVDERGKRLGLISFPTIPANCCWGGADGNDLFVTARENIFLIKDLQKD